MARSLRLQLRRVSARAVPSSMLGRRRPRAVDNGPARPQQSTSGAGTSNSCGLRPLIALVAALTALSFFSSSFSALGTGAGRPRGSVRPSQPQSRIVQLSTPVHSSSASRRRATAYQPRPFLNRSTLRIGFGSDVNEWPYLNPDVLGSHQAAASLFATPSTGQKSLAVRLTKQCDGYLGSPPPSLSSPFRPVDFDLFLGVGHFYRHHEYKLHRRALNAASKLAPPVPRHEWRGGIMWPNGAKRVPRDRNHPDYIPFLVAYSGEAFSSGDCGYYDAMIDAGGAYDPSKPVFRNCPLIFALSAFRSMGSRLNHKPSDLVLRAPPPRRDLASLKFAAFLAKRCYHTTYTPQVSIRAAFFDILSEVVRPVTALRNQAGKGCRVTADSDGVIRKSAKLTAWDAAVETYKRYKFVITFENRQRRGYVTEKIMNALLAGVVPIYFGAPDVGKYLNTNRFVFCDFNAEKVLQYPFPRGKQGAEEDTTHIVEWVKTVAGAELRACAERVKALDEDEEAYYRMVSQPILPGNRLQGSEFDLQVIVDRIKRVIEQHQVGVE